MAYDQQLADALAEIGRLSRLLSSERERCAKIADQARNNFIRMSDDRETGAYLAAGAIAAAIRKPL